MQDRETSSKTGSTSVAAEQLLSAIVDSSDDAIMSKNLDGIVTSWNKAAERTFGYSAQEMLGTPIYIIIPPERREEELTILQKLKDGEHIDHFETVRVTKGGNSVDVSLTVSPIRNAEGAVIGASTIARNITSRRQREEAIKIQQNKMEVVNRLGIALTAELDLEKLVQAVTDAGRELSGAAFAAFFHTAKQEDGEALMLYTLSGAPRSAFERFGVPRNTALFKPTFAGEGIVRVDDVMADPRYGSMGPHHGMPKGHLPVRSYMAVPVISRTSEVIGALLFGHPEPGVFNEDSEALLIAIAGHAAVAIDNARLYSELEQELTHQKEMEKTLREAEELSSNVLNSTADCITVLDLDGRLLLANPPALKQFGVDQFESVHGKPWTELWPSEAQPHVLHAIYAAKEGKIAKFQGLGPMVDEAQKWWDVIVSPLLTEDGQLFKLTTTARDITEQRRAADEVERQNRMKDEFLSTLSHELRTPLQSILGWIQLLQDRNRTEEDINQGLEVIDRNAKAQTKIIEDLLDMSRIMSGKIRLDVQRVDLASVLEATIDTVRPSAQAKNIRLHAILDPVAKPVSGDANRLQQIFWNLLSNAIKFTPNGGRVQVLLERVNSHLEVSVSDSGCGIAPEFLPHVFERFRQADATTTRRHGGLGLGLSIAKNLTELHGGSIRVKSPGRGQGSTFSIDLPLAPIHHEPEDGEREHPEVPDSQSSILNRPSLTGISVLAVDDEPDAQAVLAKMLSNAGALVRTASSAREALLLLEQELPDVIISDIGMPVEDGYTLIRSIRTLPETKGGRLPAIALTAYTRTEDRIKVFSSGFDMHLSKPANAIELLTMVGSLAKRKVAE